MEVVTEISGLEFNNICKLIEEREFDLSTGPKEFAPGLTVETYPLNPRDAIAVCFNGSRYGLKVTDQWGRLWHGWEIRRGGDPYVVVIRRDKQQLRAEEWELVWRFVSFSVNATFRRLETASGATQ